MGDSYDGAERLVGAVSVVKTYGWAETLVGDPAGLEADLAAFEYPDAEVSAVLRERTGIAEEVASIEATIKEKRRWLSYAVNTPEIVRLEQERQSLFERFADLLSGRRFVVGDVVEREVRVPLFVLAAPEPEGCVATFSKAAMTGRALVWNVTLFGSGFGGSSELRVTSTWQFEAGAGDKKQVFVPVTVSVATIRVLAGERVVKTTRKVVAAEATPAKQPGLTLLPADSRWPAGAVVDEYPLAGDTSAAPAGFSASYTKERSDRVDLGGKAFGAEVKLSADVTIAETITLSLKLTGGHDYVLRRFKTGQGMLWHVR